MERRTIGSGTPGEAEAGFSRAVRVGNMVFVSGTTAIDVEGRTQHPGDAAAQAGYVLNKIGAALKQAGATLGDVVRTRVFLRDIADRMPSLVSTASFLAQSGLPIPLSASSRLMVKCWSRSRRML